MPWTIKEQVPSLPVVDLDIAIQFYACLGFDIEWRWPKHKASHAGLRNGPAALMLVQGEVNAFREIYFVVDDVLACFDSISRTEPWEMVSASCKGNVDDILLAKLPPEPPSVKDHKHLDFTIVDPWGHRLTFGREATDSPS